MRVCKCRLFFPDLLEKIVFIAYTFFSQNKIRFEIPTTKNTQQTKKVQIYYTLNWCIFPSKMCNIHFKIDESLR